MNSNFVLRIRILLACIVVVALVLVGKLYSVQIVHGDEFTKKADRQYVKPSGVTQSRGSILFQTKDGTEVSAATIKDGFLLAIDPRALKDASAAYEQVSNFIPIDKKTFLEKASKKNDPYEEIKKRIDRDPGLSIAALNIPGIILAKDSWRVYPAGATAAQAIGLTGASSQEDSQIAGRYGLERYYEDVLKRTTDGAHVNFFAELFAGIKNSVFSKQSIEGDVVTSIEPSVQNYLEKSLSDTQKKWQSDSIGGIIINPNTGAVYAMAALPSFDPNDLGNIKDPKVFSNPLVENNYEMGSIIKPLTMAAGIDSGAITSESTYDDKGFLVLNGKRIENYDGRARGIIPMQEILSQSLNVGAAYIESKMGVETFTKYFKSYGIGDITGIDQPNEQKGLVSNLNTSRDIEHATAAYGQGIAMTPIATARALSVLANGGKLIRPHLADHIEYTIGTSVKVDGGSPEQVLKTETTDEVTRMLVTVVDKALRKGQVKMEHYSIAAKTGTAQIADPAGGGYYKDRYLHSFFGYFPAYKPQFLVFLYHVYPKGAEYASETLTDPFIDITNFLIHYYNIPPDR